MILKLMIRFCLVQVILISAQKIGELDLVNYDAQIKPDEYNFYKNQHIVLVFLKENQVESDSVLTAINELKKQIEELNESTNQQQIKIYAVKNEQYASDLGVAQQPGVLYFRDGNRVIYSGDINALKIFEWIEEMVEKKTKRFDDSSFEHDTQASTGATTGDWFVIFHEKDCKTTKNIEPTWEIASIKLENNVNLAYVDLSKSPLTKQRFNIQKPPTVIFFRKGLMYRYQLGKFDLSSIVSFTSNGWYKNVKAEKVPRELVWFDQVTDDIVAFLKDMDKKQVYGIFGMCFLLIVLPLFFVCKQIAQRQESAIKID